ncbi:hypothetical protein V2J09_018906 [Rumex salicifolius]
MELLCKILVETKIKAMTLHFFTSPEIHQPRNWQKERQLNIKLDWCKLKQKSGKWQMSILSCTNSAYIASTQSQQAATFMRRRKSRGNDDDSAAAFTRRRRSRSCVQDGGGDVHNISYGGEAVVLKIKGAVRSEGRRN